MTFCKTAGAVLHQELSRTEMIYTHGLDLMSTVPSPYVAEQVSSNDNILLFHLISSLSLSLSLRLRFLTAMGQWSHGTSPLTWSMFLVLCSVLMKTLHSKLLDLLKLKLCIIIYYKNLISDRHD